MILKRVLIGLVVLGAAVAIVFAWMWRDAEDRYVRSERMRELISQRAHEVEVRVDSLETQLSRLEQALPEVPGDDEQGQYWYQMAQRARASQYMLLDPSEVGDLKSRGLSDPVQQIRQDLLSHPELIPFDGTHGGVMQFNRDYIGLLSSQWVFARFEDGHVGGQCLLQYRVRTGGRIEWEVLGAYLDA
jgi:hypothetical protein